MNWLGMWNNINPIIAFVVLLLSLIVWKWKPTQAKCSPLIPHYQPWFTQMLNILKYRQKIKPNGSMRCVTFPKALSSFTLLIVDCSGWSFLLESERWLSPRIRIHHLLTFIHYWQHYNFMVSTTSHQLLYPLSMIGPPLTPSPLDVVMMSKLIVYHTENSR